MDFFSLMTLPFLECMILVGIHSYLGLHVIRRRVIFVDLALAQIAALGTTVAFLFGINPHSRGAYFYSLAFTFLGAAVFSLTRVRNDKVPQEAVIGLTYALAAAVGILVVFGAPHGAEHIQEIMTGTILWVKGSEVLNAGIVYALVGAFHYVFRHRFIQISENPEQAYRDGVNVRLWDFLFYMSFGLVITHSVQVAGILIVFVFLVVPAIIAVMLTDRLVYQLAIGWGFGTLVSVAGLSLSYFGDLPSGPTVVSLYGAVLITVVLVRHVVVAQRPMRVLARVMGGVVVVALIAAAFYGFGHWIAANPDLRDSPYNHHHSGMHVHHHDQPGMHQHRNSSHHGKEAAGTDADALLKKLEPLDIVGKTALLKGINDKDSLLTAFKNAKGYESLVALGQRIFALDHAKGAPLLVNLMGHGDTPPMFRDQILGALRKAYPDGPTAFDPWSAPDTKGNIEALKQWRKLVGDDHRA
ncbi:MAG: metal ABC transporter permease [Deltaproteobacteria bacterium]|nr:metal ABC transporter permease [Deltaproteobacteria bacterium]